MMFSFQMANKKGAWISFSDELISELDSKKIKYESKFQGEQKLLTHLETNSDLSDFLFEEFKKFSDAI